jgi:hypothetical protein
MTQTDVDQYTQYPSTLKPKYGMVLPSEESKMYSADTVSRGYGSDIYYLKNENIKDRLTFSIGDSLANATIVDDNDLPSLKKMVIERWEDIFIPWSHRGLMIPFFEESARTNGFIIDGFDSNIFRKFTYDFDSRWYLQYVEAQVWGEINLSHVEKFCFTDQVPTGDFLKALIKHKVKIYDSSMHLWIPPK